MANLNVDFSRGLFSNKNAVLSEVEREQLANIRPITEKFSSLLHLEKVLSLTPQLIANVPENVILGDIPSYLQTIEVNDAVAATASCMVADAMITTMNNNTSQNYTVFTTSGALDGFLLIIKDACSAIVANLRPVQDPLVMVNMANALTDSVLKNTLPFDPYSSSGFVSLETYIQQCAASSRMQIGSSLAHYDLIKQRQIFTAYALSFYPYWIANYMASFIRTSADVNTANKPASFVVRQFGVLTLKVYLVQIILLLVQKCGAITTRASLKSATRTLLYSIANEYNTEKEFDLYYKEIMELASHNNNTRTDIYKINKNVIAAKTNVEKAVINDQKAVSLVKQSSLLMYIWLTLLVIFIVAVVILYLLAKPDNNMFYYMFILCAIFVLSVFINAMVQVIRSTGSS